MDSTPQYTSNYSGPKVEATIHYRTLLPHLVWGSTCKGSNIKQVGLLVLHILICVVPLRNNIQCREKSYLLYVYYASMQIYE